MKLLNYINSHDDWQTSLSVKPYSLSIKSSPPYFTLKYNMLESDFNYEEVWDARGLVIRYDGTKYIPISFGLRKFFNATEKWASPIDWATAQVQAKIDGSNIRFAYDKIARQWLCSTMGNPDANDAPISDNFTFFDAVVEVLGGVNRYNEFLTLLDKKYTYIFELVSRYNIICCHYEEQKLYYISRRNMETEYEELERINFPGFEKEIAYPQTYSLSTYEDCVRAAEALEENNEGFVVVDAMRNRVKIKTPWYMAMHKLRGNGALTVLRVVEMWQNDSLDDFIAYYPEFRSFVDEVIHQLQHLIEIADVAFATIMRYVNYNPSNRRTFARYACTYIGPLKSFLFARLDNKVQNAYDFYKGMRAKSLSAHLQTLVSKDAVGVNEDE